jgi:hypothetical protein
VKAALEEQDANGVKEPTIIQAEQSGDLTITPYSQQVVLNARGLRLTKAYKPVRGSACSVGQSNGTPLRSISALPAALGQKPRLRRTDRWQKRKEIAPNPASPAHCLPCWLWKGCPLLNFIDGRRTCRPAQCAPLPVRSPSRRMTALHK